MSLLLLLLLAAQTTLPSGVYQIPAGSTLTVPAASEPSTQPEPPVVGTVLNSPQEFMAAAAGNKVDTYLVPRGAVWDFTPLLTPSKQIDFHNASTFDAAPGEGPKPVFVYHPTSLNTPMMVNHAAFTLRNVDLDTNVKTRVFSPYASGATFEHVSFVGNGLGSFIEMGGTRSAAVNGLTLSDMTVPFALDRFFIYTEVSPGVWHSDWRVLNCHILKGSVNEGIFRLKSVRNFTISGGEYRDTGGSKMYCGVFEFADGGTVENCVIQSEFTVMPNDGNPDAVFINVPWSRSITFQNVDFQDGSLRLNPGSLNITIKGCTLNRSTYPHFINCPAGHRGLAIPTGTVSNTSAKWTGQSTSPKFIDGTHAVIYQGQGNTLNGVAQ